MIPEESVTKFAPGEEGVPLPTGSTTVDCDCNAVLSIPTDSWQPLRGGHADVDEQRVDCSGCGGYVTIYRFNGFYYRGECMS